ncbi:cellulase family glycosylhydrolase [Catenuloplanes indicus]|uniref:mannan endo-1,4-beta-mannosidase n=1 Tax=Catenuloplanes indicus TaxID=137267 RepID=A0AAE3W4Y2_9ACTN|nr:cellulase family glycosylhydrolase [Catenuloplanes indicus]MDQ0369365.1 hypothetical protein [Catenuloplanes indicus]
MIRTGTTARGLSARVAAFGVALLAAVVVPAPGAHAATRFEAETLTIDPAYGSAYQDPVASGGWALAIWNNAAATGGFTAAAPFTTLSVSSMGGVCGSTDAAPRMEVAVDGTVVGRTAVTGAWSRYQWTGSWAAGSHSISFRFLNEYGDGTCDRFLEVDTYRVSSDLGFVTRAGAQLMLGGRPYTFAGLNAFGMSGCDNGSVPWTDAQLDSYFGQLAPNTVTRTWAFQPYGLPVLDRIVAAAERHGQRVSLTLADGRNYCGEHDGMNGSKEGADKTLAWYQGGFRANYLPWATSVVSRFRDATAVAWWELINEPGSFTDPAYTDAIIKAFFDEAAAAVKAADPNHLVATGTMYQAFYGTSDFAYVHSGPHVDIASIHEYEYDWQNSNAIVTGHLTPALAKMQSIGKPLIIGESGLQAAASGCRTTLTARASVVTRKLNAYLAYTGVAGVNIWGVVLYNPVSAQDPCPLQGRLTDPMFASIRAKQTALNA